MRALNGIWVTWKSGGKDGLRFCVIKDTYGLKEVHSGGAGGNPQATPHF